MTERFRIKKTLTQEKGRECGDCRMCCKLVGIAALDKPAGRWCEHACSKGCGIYDERPSECQTYECLWLAGLLPARLKPNKAKVIAHLRNPTEERGAIVVVNADQPGSLDRGRGKEVLDWCKAHFKIPIYICVGGQLKKILEPRRVG